MNEIFSAALEIQQFCEQRQWGKLNLDLVRTELKPLVDLKEEPEIMHRLEKLIHRHGQPFKIIKPTNPGKGEL